MRAGMQVAVTFGVVLGFGAGLPAMAEAQAPAAVKAPPKTAAAATASADAALAVSRAIEATAGAARIEPPPGTVGTSTRMRWAPRTTWALVTM